MSAVEPLVAGTARLAVGNFTNSSWHVAMFVMGNRVSASLSLVGSVLVVITFLGLPKVRTFFVQLAFCLSVADLGQEVFLLFGLPEEHTTCIVQGVLLGMFTQSTIIWPLLMSITLFVLVFRVNSNPERYVIGYHLIAWGVPVIVAVLPFSTGSYGPAGILCWMTEANGGTVWRLVQVYGLVWVVLLVNTILYTAIGIRVRQSASALAGLVPSQKRTAYMDEAGRLAIYPIIMAIAYVPASVDRVQNMVAPDEPIFVLQMIHIVLVALCGAMNAIAFLTTPSVRRELRMFFVRWGCCAPPPGLQAELELASYSMRSLAEPLVEVRPVGLPVKAISSSPASRPSAASKTPSFAAL